MTKKTKRTEPKPKRHPELLKASAEMTVTGRIHGTGKRLTEAEREQARKLRAKDPKVYTLRRLSAIFGVDPGSMWYCLNGGRKSAEDRRAKAKARKVKATPKAKRVPKPKPAAKPATVPAKAKAA